VVLENACVAAYGDEAAAVVHADGGRPALTSVLVEGEVIRVPCGLVVDDGVTATDGRSGGRPALASQV
jgi:hypothetical protein